MRGIDAWIPAPAPNFVRDAPGPRGFPVLGVLPRLSNDPLTFFVRTAQDFPDVARLPLGLENVLMLNRPELVRHVLQDRFENYRKGKYFDLVKLLFGNGVFTADGPVWLRHRRTAQPAFNGSRLSAMTAPMVRAVDDMVIRWRSARGPVGQIDIAKEMTELTLDIVLRTLFSTTLDERYQELHASLHAVLRDIERRIWAVFNVPTQLPTPQNKALRAKMALIRSYVDDLIARRCQSEGAQDDLFSLVLASGGVEDDDTDPATDVRTQLLGMVIAGHETTANALSWTWYLVSRHPEIEEKLRAEVHSVLGDREPRFEDFAALKYSQAVMAESMRLFPPIWTISRAAVEEDEIAGVCVRPGNVVMMCAYAMHRNPRYWRSPETFDPDRFLNDGGRSAARSYIYFPFGGGPRTCLGARFAMLEGTVVIARLLQHGSYSSIERDAVVAEPMISLRPRGGVPMIATLRT